MLICYIKFSKSALFEIRKLKDLKSFDKNMKNCSEINDKKNLGNPYLIYFNNSKCVGNLRFGYIQLFTNSHSFEHLPFYIHPSRFIFWFRNDLDFEENFSLKFAMSLPLSPIFIYCYDSKENVKSSFKRKQFIEKTLENLKIKLSLLNIQLLILNGSITNLIPQVVKKYNSTRIIYSLNAFIPLDCKNEKNFIHVLKKIGVYPMIFILDPLTMKPIFSCFKKKFKSFPSFFLGKDLENKINLNKRNHLSKEHLRVFENTKNWFDSHPSRWIRFSKNNFYRPPNYKKNFGDFSQWKKIDFKLDIQLLKNVFSEFNLGFRCSFNKINKKNIVLYNIKERIKLNSNLKIFFFTKKLIKNFSLTEYLMNNI
jgi:hypothetical protein